MMSNLRPSLLMFDLRLPTCAISALQCVLSPPILHTSDFHLPHVGSPSFISLFTPDLRPSTCAISALPCTLSPPVLHTSDFHLPHVGSPFFISLLTPDLRPSIYPIPVQPFIRSSIIPRLHSSTRLIHPLIRIIGFVRISTDVVAFIYLIPSSNLHSRGVNPSHLAQSPTGSSLAPLPTDGMRL